MSNFQEETDWWEGADGKWYPPVAKKTEAAPVVEFQVSAPASKVKRSRVRVYVSGVAAMLLLGAGIFVYQSNKTEFVDTTVILELTDISRGSGQWSVLPDCENKEFGGGFDACSCALSVGYSDLNRSTPVVVFGASGNEVGRSELGAAWFFHLRDGPIGPAIRSLSEYDAKRGRKCYWNADISVPDNEDYYVVKVGNRGEVKYNLDELWSGLWPTLTIQDD